MITSPYMQWISVSSVRDGNDFGHDTERDLGRSLAADVEPDRDSYSAQLLLGDSVVAKHLLNRGPAAAAAEEADVRRIGSEDALQNRDVVLVIVRDEDDR